MKFSVVVSTANIAHRRSTPMRAGAFIAVLTALCLFPGTRGASVRGQNQISRLEPDKPITREISSGQTHVYPIHLNAGQFVRIVAEQRAVNLKLAILTPDGARVAEVNNFDDVRGAEFISVIAATAGEYRLEVNAVGRAAGRYELRLTDQRAATERDRTHIAAQQLYAEAWQLNRQNNIEIRRQAVPKFEEAQRLWQSIGATLEEAAASHILMWIYYGIGNQPKAAEYGLRAVALWQSLGNREWEAISGILLTMSYHNRREFEQALAQSRQALAIFQSLGDRDGLVSANNVLARTYTSMGEYQKAIEARTIVLRLAREMNRPQQVAGALSSIGEIYDDQGDYPRAIEHFRQAQAIYRQINNQQREANVLYMLGELYFHRLRDDQQAFDCYERAITLARASGARRDEAYALGRLGTMYVWLGDQPKAVKLFDQVLQIWRELGDRKNEADLLTRLFRNSLTPEEWANLAAFWQSDKARQAFEFLDRSRSLYRELEDRNEAMPLSLLSFYYAAKGDRRQALEAAERALQLSPTLLGNVQALIRGNLARTYAQLGDESRELELLEQAYREPEGDPERRARSALELAQALRQRGRLDEARARLDEAITLKESLRAKLADLDLRTGAAVSLATSYEIYADLLMQLHERAPGQELEALAFQATERARARSLLDILNEARVDLRQDADPALLAREITLQQQLSALTVVEPTPTDGARDAGKLEKELEAKLDALRRVRAQIRQSSPRYAAITHPQAPTLAEIQTELLDAGTMLLAYSLGDERSFLWAITPDSFTTHQLPSRKEVNKATRDVQSLMTVRQRLKGLTPVQQQKRVAEAEARLRTESAMLSQTLLGPVAAQLGKKRLLIVAPEALQYLPFAALPEPTAANDGGRVGTATGRERLPTTRSLPVAVPTQTRKNPQSATPLVVNHEIINLPSVSVMMFLRRELAGRKAAPKAVAVLADPVFAADDPRVKSGAATTLFLQLERSLRSFSTGAEREGLARLVLSRDEAEAITSAVPASEGLKALDFKASREAATDSALGQYRIVHFATHGLLNTDHPELSGLVFSLVDAEGRPQDGFLRLHEIYNLKLPAELVVLSACQTGLGKAIQGEGLVGLTRGFMHAGAARVVASLWRVDDYATSALMKRFYRGMLKDGMRPAEALRKAQIEMWRQKQWQSPFYWGAFVLQGEWR